MEHLTLTETEFFRLISNPDSRTGLRTAYDEFTQRVIHLCLIPPESGHPVHALSYAETELQYHEALQGRSHESELNLHVHKALAFVRKMLRFLAREYHPLPPSHMFTGEKTGAPPSDAPPICWTGSISDLVELLYGLDTLKCINGGETGIQELMVHFSRFFGMELKPSQCYNAYVDIRRRKNDSRTYFFDRASEKLNERIVKDDERERARKR